MWSHLKSGAHAWSGVQGVGQRLKIQKVQRRLAEGIRELHRRFLLDAQSVAWALASEKHEGRSAQQNLRTILTISEAIHQDKRGGKMLMRYTATNSRLQRRSGVLGLKSAGGSVIEIVQCTDSMLHDFCAIGLNRPNSSLERRLQLGSQDCQVDTGLLSHLKSHIDFFNADAERAEQLAGSHCRRPLLAAARPVLPALRVVN